MEILDTKEVCALFKLRRLTLYKMIQHEGLPAFRLGRAWKFEKGALHEWIKERTEKSRKSLNNTSI